MTPDGLIVWYYKKRETFGAPGFNFVDSEGRKYAEECICGYKIRHQKMEGGWVCGRCGKPWAFEDLYIFKGEVRNTNRGNMAELKNSRWIDVGTNMHFMIVDPKWKWDTMLYVATCMGFPVKNKRGGLNNLAVRFRRLWPDAPGPWSPATIYRRVNRARDEWVRRLELAGIKTT